MRGKKSKAKSLFALLSFHICILYVTIISPCSLCCVCVWERASICVSLCLCVRAWITHGSNLQRVTWGHRMATQAEADHRSLSARVALLCVCVNLCVCLWTCVCVLPVVYACMSDCIVWRIPAVLSEHESPVNKLCNLCWISCSLLLKSCPHGNGEKGF